MYSFLKKKKTSVNKLVEHGIQRTQVHRWKHILYNKEELESVYQSQIYCTYGDDNNNNNNKLLWHILPLKNTVVNLLLGLSCWQMIFVTDSVMNWNLNKTVPTTDEAEDNKYRQMGKKKLFIIEHSKQRMRYIWHHVFSFLLKISLKRWKVYSKVRARK